MAAAIAASEDEDLVAVITAAIAAYQGTSSNGLVVRSIRRVDREEETVTYIKNNNSGLISAEKKLQGKF